MIKKGKKNIIKGATICFVCPGYCYCFQGSPTGRKFTFNSLDQEVSEFMRILATQEPSVFFFIEKTKYRAPCPRSAIKSIWRKWKGLKKALPGWLLIQSIRPGSKTKVGQSLAYILRKRMITERAFEFMAAQFFFTFLWRTTLIMGPTKTYSCGIHLV